MTRTWHLLPLLLLGLPLQAASLRPVGILGNSGYAGPALCHSHPGGYAGGVVADAELTLWHPCAPDRVERLGLDGRVLTAYQLEGGRMGDLAHNIRVALCGDYVVVLQVHSGQVYAFRRDADPAQPIKPLKLDPPLQFWYASSLGQNPIGGRLITHSGQSVFALDPATGKTEKLFEVAERISEHGLEVAPDGTIYLATGGTYAYDATGKVLRRGEGMWGRINWVGTGLLALNYNGGLQFAPPSLSPLMTLFHNATIEVGRAGQAVSLGGNLIALASQAGPVYLGEMSAERLTYTRRLGALHVQAVGLSASGEVLVSSYGGMMAWHWDDAADALPFYTHSFVDCLAVRQIASRGGYNWGIKEGYRGTEPIQAWGWPLTRYGVLFSTLEGQRPARPRGFAVSPEGRAFLSSESTADLWTTTVGDLNVAANVKLMAWAGENPLQKPGDLAAGVGNKLAVADGSAVVLLEPAGEQYRVAGRLTAWGTAPEQHFGEELHLAASGDYLLVSDTTRHRVLVFSLADQSLLAQLGTTDTAGGAFGALDQPAEIAANGMQVVVYDRGNQRLVTCELKP